MGVFTNIQLGLKNIADGLITGAKLVNNTVTFAKVQQIASLKLLGNATGGTANISEIGLANGLQIETDNIYTNQVLNSQSASYTLLITDESKTIITTGASVIDITVPLNSSVAFLTGTTIGIIGTGTGLITIVATGGVTINSKDGLKLDGQYSVASITKIDINTWIATGRLIL